jgi:hypothetical protein
MLVLERKKRTYCENHYFSRCKKPISTSSIKHQLLFIFEALKIVLHNFGGLFEVGDLLNKENLEFLDGITY